MDPAGRPAVEIDALEKVYRGVRATRALDGIDLRVQAGEVFGLLGPNGAGKTTTVGVATTRLPPTGGRVTVDGVDVVADPPGVRRRIGVVTQFNTLDRACTARENLVFHCRYFGLGAAEARRRADRLLERFRLAVRADAMPDELSGGTQQRLQIARAVAHGPRVLFLDEPTAGLDPQSRLAVWEIVQDLRGAGMTVFLTTHHMEEADQLCQRVAIIDHGRILVCDAPAALKRGVQADTVLELTVDGPLDGLAERLGRLDGVGSVEETGSGVRLLGRTADGLLPRVVEAAQGHRLRDIAVSEPTLETVFISLTGRDLRD